MQFEELNFDEFEEDFKSLKRNKAAGFGDSSSNFIIHAYDRLKISYFMCSRSLFNKEYFVDNLKLATFKTDEKDNISNYSPISILPAFSKVLEKSTYNRVCNHLDSKSLVLEKQFGFQESNSIAHAILQLTRDIAGSVKKGNIQSEFL